jgi:hypothetical protein
MDKFSKPLNQVITEYHEVERDVFEVNGETGEVNIKRVKDKIPIKTIYTKATSKKFTCGEGKHYWTMIDRHRHVAKCKHCRKHRYLRAVYEKIDGQGHIVDRETGELID